MCAKNYTLTIILIHLTCKLALRKGINCLGIVRSNRLPNLTVIGESALKKKGRGAFAEQVASVDGINLSVARWYDYRAVTFLSTFVGAQPVNNIQRFSRVSLTQQQTACPKVIQVCNAHMGEVDLSDSFIGRIGHIFGLISGGIIIRSNITWLI